MLFSNNIVLLLKIFFSYIQIFFFSGTLFCSLTFPLSILSEMAFTSNVIQNFSKAGHVELVADRKLDVRGIRIL